MVPYDSLFVICDHPRGNPIVHGVIKLDPEWLDVVTQLHLRQYTKPNHALSQVILDHIGPFTLVVTENEE